MKILEALIAWNPETAEVEVGPWPDRYGWSDKYDMTAGACESRMHNMTKHMALALTFINFNTAVIRDNVDPQAAHRAFLKIDEYRRHISLDTEGATPGGEWMGM